MGVVFNGYDDIHSIKSVEHFRRSQGVVIAPDIKIGNLQMRFLVKKNEFLRNVNNKKKFYKVIRKKLEDHAIESYQSYGTPDVLIVEKAMQKIRDVDIITVVADDTDILILLLYHWHDNKRAVYFLTERKGPGASKGSKLKVMRWEIGKLVSNLINCLHMYSVDVTQYRHALGS